MKSKSLAVLIVLVMAVIPMAVVADDKAAASDPLEVWQELGGQFVALKALNLTEAQQKAAMRIVGAGLEKTKTAWQNASLTREQKQSAIEMAIFTGLLEFRQELTDEQKTKFDAMLRSAKEKQLSAVVGLVAEIQTIRTDLALTSEQEEKIVKILMAQKDKFQALCAEGVTTDQKKDGMIDILQVVILEVRRALNPDQQTKYDALVLKMRAQYGHLLK